MWQVLCGVMTVCDTTPTYGGHSNVTQVSAGTNIVDLLGVLSHDYSLSMCEVGAEESSVQGYTSQL